VVLQFGGSDQWGNIVAGIELTRKVVQRKVYGLTAPLITTSDGRKMGKSADGAIWLDRSHLSEYNYWQYWRNTPDQDVIRFLKLFTDLSMEEIQMLAQLKDEDINKAKVGSVVITEAI
jgi:tyrosyl-tRNA synthetase